MYAGCFLYRWLLATRDLCALLRDEVCLPLHPDFGESGTIYKRVDTAIVLPSWHCAFDGCAAASSGQTGDTNHEAGLWHHIWTGGSHKKTLQQLLTKHSLNESHMRGEETAFTLYNQALAEKERQSCPLVGVATDRRALLHVGEVFKEDNVTTLMCFICGCKILNTTVLISLVKNNAREL